MSYQISPAGIRDALLGVQANRATATLPASTTGSVFTVSGGRIVLTSLVGEVTTIIQAQACTLAVVSTPTAGSAVTLGAASASLSGLEVGGHITLAATVGGNTVVSNAGGVALPAALAFLVPAGSIQITTSATNTGSVKWSMTYIPYDDAATVVAA